MKPIFFSVLLAFFSAIKISAAEWRWSAPTSADHRIDLELWIDESGGKISTIILYIPGTNGDGRDFCQNPKWREFAKFTNCALLGIQAQGNQGGFYYEPRQWSGQLLMAGLDDLSQQSSHPELATIGLFLWGQSAGGQFAYNFACWKPNLVQALAAGRGAYYAEKASAEIRRIPALWISGANDTDIRLQNITSLFAENRRKGAPWILAIEPDTGHEIGQSETLVMAFFSALLQKSGSPEKVSGLWTGSLTDHQIRPLDFQKDRPPSPLTVELPDESFAKIWQAFVQGRLEK